MKFMRGRGRNGGELMGAERGKFTFLHHSKKFKQISNLSNVNKHSDKYRFVCVLCWKTYKTANRLLKHSNLSHLHKSNHDLTNTVSPFTDLNKSSLFKFPLVKIRPNGQIYHCGECSYRTTHKINISQHVKTHSAEKQFKTECNIQLKLSEEPVQNKKGHLGFTLLKCPKCSYNTNCYSIYSQHIFKHIEQEPTLRLLSNSFEKNKRVGNNNSIDRSHLSRQVGPSSAKTIFQSDRFCNITGCSISNSPGSPCNNRTAYQILFNRFLPSYRRTKFRKSLVKRCLTSNSFKQSLSGSSQQSNHEKPTKRNHSGNGIMPNQDRCGSTRTRTRTVQQTKIKKSARDSLLACPMCDYRTHKVFLLKCHTMVHNGIRPFKCPHCPYACIWKTNLSKHMKVHSGIIKSSDMRVLKKKLPKRDQCLHTTLFKGNFKKHMNSDHSCDVKLCKLNGSYCFNTTKSSGIMVSESGVKEVLDKDSLVCPHCRFKTAVKSALTTHMTIHSKRELLKCPHCHYACIWKGNLSKHIRVNHSDNKKSSGMKVLKKKLHKCKQCPYTTLFKGNLNKHMNSKHSYEVKMSTFNGSDCFNATKSSGIMVSDVKEVLDKDWLVCPHCGFKTAIKSALTTHMTIHYKKKLLKCPHCHYACIWKGDMSNHIKVSHSGNKGACQLVNKKLHQCEQCPYTTLFKGNLNKHMNSKHSLEVKVCKLNDSDCLNATKSSGIMLSDVKEVLDKDSLVCSHCGFKAASKSGLITHMTIHSEEKPLKRYLNEHISLEHSEMVKHIKVEPINLKTVHLKNYGMVEESKPKNSHCLYATRSSGIIVPDFKKIIAEESFFCSHCDYNTPKKATLISHLIIHSEKKSFKCEQCPYSSLWERNLNMHIKNKHLSKDVKPLKCELCPYASLQKKKLKNHIKNNHFSKDVNPFKCEICPYTSLRKASLNNHVKSKHLGEYVKPFECELCPYASLTKINLKKHIKLQHSKNKFLSGPIKSSICLNGEIPSRHNDSCKNKPCTPLLTCPHCRYQTPNKWLLERHLMIHSGERPIKCLHCPYATIWHSNLSKHMNYKHKEFVRIKKEKEDKNQRVHSISISKCLKDSNQSNCDHKRCRLNDSDNKLVPKSQKNKKLSNNTGKSKFFKINMSKDLEEKPQYFSHCTHRETDKPRLARHILTHSETKTYSCDRCDLKFTRQGNLIAHIRRMHKTESRINSESTEVSSYPEKSKLLFIKHSYESAQEQRASCLKSDVNFNYTTKKILLKPFQCSDHTYASKPLSQASTNVENPISLCTDNRIKGAPTVSVYNLLES